MTDQQIQGVAVSVRGNGAWFEYAGEVGGPHWQSGLLVVNARVVPEGVVGVVAERLG